MVRRQPSLLLWSGTIEPAAMERCYRAWCYSEVHRRTCSKRGRCLPWGTLIRTTEQDSPASTGIGVASSVNESEERVLRNVGCH